MFDDRTRYAYIMTEYNVDSSLKRLIRRGKSHTGPRTIDSLSYSYTRGRMTGLTERAATNRLSGSFEISRKGSFTYRYDTSGSLVGDSYRGISSVRYDMRGNPVFVAFDSGDETEYGYTTDGVKLWTIHRTVPGALSKETIDASKEKVTAEINCEPLRSSLLSDSPSATGSSFAGTSLTGTPSGVSQSSGITGRQPKGTTAKSAASAPVSAESPVLKVSPAELSRLSNVLVQSVDVTRYYDSYEFDDASLTEGKYYFGGGYVSFHSGGAVEYSAIVSDYRGSTRVVLSAAGGSLQQSVQQLNGYYPSGALVADYQTSHLGGTSSADVQTRKFTGKELDRMHGLDWHDFGARRYDAAAVFFTSPDPLSEKYYHINPYVYCAGNPVNRLDPDGRDWYQNDETSYYTWFEGSEEREGYTNIGDKGSLLGEFEDIINNILCGEDGIDVESLYSDGFTLDIAPNDKGGLIASKERGWDFFDEFLYGSGPEFSVILEDHPYTQSIMKEDFVKKSQDVIRSRGEHGNYTNVKRHQFYPWQAKVKDPLQFIGTYRYDGYSSEDGKYINNVATDTKSVTSLGLHLPFLNNHRRSQKSEYGTTYQFYIWRSEK